MNSKNRSEATRSVACRGISYTNNFPEAYVYFESEPGRRSAGKILTKDEARKIANGIVKLPELLKRPQPT